MPLIDADQTFALSAVIMVIVAFGLWAETRPWGQQLGGPLLLLAIAMAASNLGIIPYSAPVYGTIAGFLVPAAIPLLLMRADLRTIFSESGPMLIAFVLAASATVAGALVGVLLVDMGPLEAQIAGTVTSSYIGGSLNFVATAEAVGIKDSSIYVAGLSADAVGAVFFLILLMLMPAVRFIRNAMPSKFIGHTVIAIGAEQQGDSGSQESGPFKLVNAAMGLAVSMVVCGVGAALTAFVGIESLFILVVTALSLVVANFAKPIVRQVSSEFQIGTLFMYIFFVAIGAGANLGDVLGAAFPIVMFIVVMVIVHLGLLVVIGKWMKLDLAEVLIASNACILGPAPAAALAASKGWQPLVAPGILVGLFGYAIATFVGVALSALLSWQVIAITAK
ncbi:MAG: DUF819 family protein [Gammaproteobacteria bacterium]|nr:DUF819 family protein [Gammaproteobacteria bacterium]MDH4316002.1 DUF819 family protein [Gammaproteobacteria bacterium]MDH5214861.1 DUF819 family protein [Gammaproteobacteria bacterium]